MSDNKVSFKFIDATPDDDYPLRILRTYLEDCNYIWTDNTSGKESKSALIEAITEMQKKRAVILDKAIHAITNQSALQQRIAEQEEWIRKAKTLIKDLSVVGDTPDNSKRLADLLDSKEGGE